MRKNLEVFSLLALVLLAGCANRGNPNLHTDANWATVHFVGAQPTQADVDACALVADRVYWANLANTAWGNIGAGAYAGGSAYEACMLARGFVVR